MRGLFKKNASPPPPPPPPTPKEKANLAMSAAIHKVGWRFESALEGLTTVRVPPRDGIPMECRLRLENLCWICILDAGVRVSQLRALNLLIDVDFAPFGSLRVCNENGFLALIASTAIRSNEHTGDDIAKAMSGLTEEFMNFLVYHIKQKTLYFPLDFNGIADNAVAMKAEFIERLRTC